ncbi:hypothetical protein AVEN_141183-1 [Araneus ventricosus]|uniref:Uncharacterized protein n=1 Tax=Araneus ventricosus TaxID=182803 RepID=A0A4Y2EQI5_ARAVE|nr:hypothetical protein AVEN_141183-1 [Araneus ventricosus]
MLVNWRIGGCRGRGTLQKFYFVIYLENGGWRGQANFDDVSRGHKLSYEIKIVKISAVIGTGGHVVKNNIPGTEVNNLKLNESISNADPSFLVSHYEEKLSSSMKVLLMFNKELSHMKKKNEENEIENTRLKLRIQHLEKILSKHVAEFNKDDKIDVCKNVNISPTSSSEIPRNSGTLLEKVDNLCSNFMNQDRNGSTPEISLPSNSPAKNNYCYNSFILQNEISSNPSVNERKTFTKRKIIHSEKPLSNQQNPQKLESFHFHEIKTEPQSPCKFNPIEISENCTNNSTTELSESSITTIILKEEKELVLDEFLVNVRTQQKNLENDIIINKSPPFGNKENAWISNNDSLTYHDDTIPGEMDISTNCGDFEHQKESLSTEKNISYVKETLEAGYENIVDTVSCISSFQMQQTEAQYTSADKNSFSLTGDSTEAIIDESENTESETGWNSKKKQKRYKKKRISITAQTSKSQQRQISPQSDLLIKKPYKENSINSRNLCIRQSFSEGDISTEAVVSESELSENDASANPRRKRKRVIKRIASHKTLFNNEQINFSVERLLKSEIGESESGGSTETSATASNQSKYVKNSADKKRKRKLKMKSNLIDLANIKSVGSPKPSHIEESDSSIQIPPRKRMKTLDSETSDDIPFSIKERAFQSEIINEISPEQDISTGVNVNQDSDTKSNTNIVPKRKLRSHKKEGKNFNKDSDTESSRHIVSERKLRSQKKGGMNVNQDSNTESNRSIVPERKLRSHKKRGVNVHKGSDTEKNRSIVPDRKVRSHKEGGGNVNQDSNTESNGIIMPRRKLRSRIKGEVNINLDSNTEIDMSIVPKKKLRSHKKGDTSLCVSTCIGSRSKENSSSSEETCSPIRKSLRKKMQIIECDSSNAKANQTPKRIVQKRLNCHGKPSENGNGLIKKCSEILKRERHLNETLSKKGIISLERTKIPSPLSHENSIKDHTISEEETDAISQTTNHQKEQLSKNSLENKLEVINVSAEENKLFEDLIYSELKNTIIPAVGEKENLKEKSLSKFYKNANQKLAINENQLPKRNYLAEVEEHIALKPMQIPSLCNSQISETLSNEQEVSTKRTFMSKEKNLKQISTKCSTSLEEIKRLVSENSANENIREISEKHLHKLQEYGSLKPTSSAYTKEVSQQDRIYIEEANLKEIPPLKCFVLLKKITSPPGIVNREPMNDNHLGILPSEDAVSSLKEKIKFPVSSALATNQEAEHEIETEQHTTSTLKDAVNSTKENCEEDLIFDTDDSPDINSDNISPESIYDDSDCDPDWFMDDDSFQEPSEFSVKKNQKRILSLEDSGSDDVPLRERNIHKTAKKSGHLSSKESTKNLKVKFNVPKKKKLNRKVRNKKESSLENRINSAIKEDLTRKNETRNKYEKLFWGTDVDSDSSSELIVDEGNDKHLAENADLNNSAKTIATEGQACDLNMKDAFSIVSGGCVKGDEILKNQGSDYSLKITENSVVKSCKNNAKKKTKIESIDSDFDFDAELITDEINCETLVLPENLITNNHQKILLVEDRIFGSDSSLNNEENTTTKEWKNNDEDNSACNDKTVLKNNSSNDDTNSDFDPELIDEIICEELQLPEHLIINVLQKNKQVEDRIVRSNDGIKNTEQCKDLTVEEDDPICYNKTMYKKNKKHNDKSDSDISPELTICERNCEELQLPENLIENDHQKILPIEDKVFGSPCSLTNISTERSEKVAAKSPICHDKTVCKINKFYSDSNDSVINSELIGNGQNCEQLQLPENDHEEFMPIEDKISGSICSLENTITEKCEKVIIEEGNSTGNEKIVHKINKNCITNSNSDIDAESIGKEPNCGELNLPESDHQKNMSVTDRMLKFTKENEMLSSKANDAFCKTESDLLQIQLSCSNVKNIGNATSETCENISVISVSEKSPICHHKTVCKINTSYSDGDSDINSELIGNGQNCEELQLPEKDCEEFMPVEDKISGSICSLENTITEKCEKVIIEEGNSTGNEKIFHKIIKICSTNSNSDIDADSIRKEPNCKELNLPESDHQKNISVTDRMLKFTKENEMLSSKENDTFCKPESDLLQTQPSCNNVKNIGNVTSETCDNISVISEKEEFKVKTVGKEEENYSVSDINISDKMGLIIDEADNDELIQDCLECDLMNSLPVDAEVSNTEKENTSEEEALVSEIELKILEKQTSGSCVRSMEDIVSEKNNTFVEHKKEVSTHNDMTIKSMENYNLDIDNHSVYAAELVSEPVKAKNYENLNEKDSDTYDNSQVQICENENSQTEFLEDSLDYLNKSTEKLLQTNLQNDIIPNVSTKLNPNKSSSLSKINRDSDQMLKANENQFCTKAVFPISHSKCVPVKTLNISKIGTQTGIETKQPSYQTHTSQKSCTVSVNEKSVAAFEKSQHKGNLPISLPETSKTGITKTTGRRSENFHRHRDAQRYFKHKRLGKRKTCNEYLKYKNVKINLENPIKSILQGIDVKENFYTQLKPHTSLFVASVRFNHCVKSLVNYLMHPDKTPDMTYLIFLVIKYLHHTRQNPLENFSKNQENVFIPATENCIVTALFEIEKKSKPGFQELLETILNVMHQFILAKNKMHIYGLASLCRVLTEICKHKNDKLKPLHLCCDLLKEKHKFASILIISVAKVWKELFWISDNLLEEENALQISIAYGITKSVKSSAIVSMYCSLEVVSEYFDISRNMSDINKVIEILKNEILEKSTQNSLKNSWKLTLPFVIFASFETWGSTKKHLIDHYIIPNLQWFSHHVANEEAFDLFSNLYVDVLLLFPEHNPDELLMKFFHTSSACEGDSFIQDCTAVALIKHFILSKRNVPLFLTTWQEENQTKPKVKALKILFQRRLMSDTPTAFSKDEIIISSK